ncbi:MAG: hypothetical protein H7274_02715 [Rhodoferax sp.]|nr:hypothetical protein [Rhodoferax sp.]
MIFSNKVAVKNYSQMEGACQLKGAHYFKPKANPIMTITASDFSVKNATSADVNALNSALLYLQGSTTGAAMVAEAAANGTTINIIRGGVAGDNYTGRGDHSGGVINWDPNGALQVVTNSGAGTPGYLSPALVLLHEFGHDVDPNFMANQVFNAQYDTNAEQFAIGKENVVAVDLGEAQRLNHNGSNYFADISTQHAINTYTAGNLTSQVVDAKIYTQPVLASNLSPVLSQDIQVAKDFLAGTVTTSTINYNPGPNDPAACTWDIKTTSIGNPNVVQGEVIENVTSSGTTATIAGYNNKVTLDNAYVKIVDGSEATITGTNNGILIGNNDSIVVAGSSNTTFVQGTRDATVIQGTGEKTVVTGTSNTVSDQGTGDHNWLTGTGNTINVIGSSNTTEVQNTGNTANIKGVSDITVVESNNDTTNITGTTDQTWTEGTNDTTSVQGTSAATVILGNNSQTSVSGVTDTTWVLGATDVTTVTGSGEATVVQGSTDSTTISGNNETSWIQGSHDTTTESGTSDTAYVSGASDITWAQGNYDSTWQTGVGDVAHELNSSDTVYDSGTGDSYQNEWTGGYYGGYGGGGGGYYGYYSSKISNAAGSNIISISGKEVIHGNTSSSITANASPSQAPMPPSLLASTGGAGNAVLEAAQWDQVAITWKSTSGIDPASSSLVGIPNSSYDAVFGGAFAASLKVAVVDIGQLPQSAGLGGGIGLDKLIPSPTIATSMAQLTQSMGSFAPSAPGHMESLAANEASWRFAPMAAASR